MEATAGVNRCPFGLKLPLLNAVPTHGPCRFSPTVVLSDFGPLENFCGFRRNSFSFSFSRRRSCGQLGRDCRSSAAWGFCLQKLLFYRGRASVSSSTFLAASHFPTTSGFNFFGPATVSEIVFLRNDFSCGSRTGFPKASGTSTTSQSSSTPRTCASQLSVLREGATPSTFPFVVKPNMLEDFRPKLFVFHFASYEDLFSISRILVLPDDFLDHFGFQEADRDR